MLRYALLLLLNLSLISSCLGSDWTVPVCEPNYGNGSNSGSDGDEQENPATPETIFISSAAELVALGELKPGTEVVWRDGTYADQLLMLKGKATAEQPIILRAETPGGVHFTGLSRLEIRGTHLQVSGFWWQDPTPKGGKAVITFHRDSRNSTLSECAITGSGLQAEAAIDTKWVSLYGQGHRVERCSFLGKRNKGALMVVWFSEGVTPRHYIAQNHFERPMTLFDENGKAINGQETIRVGDSNSSMSDGEVVVEGNFFYECHGEQAEIISNKSCANIYRGNLFERSHGTLTLRHGNRCHVVGNYFLGGGVDGSGGVRIIGEDHLVEQNYMQDLRGSGYKAAITLVRGEKDPLLSGYWQVRGAVVRNNIVVDCRYGFQVNYGTSTQTKPVVESRIENNIVVQSDDKFYAVNCVTDPRPQVEWKSNYFYGGRMVGVDLEMLDQRPRTPKVEAVVEQIRSRSGVSW